jgi:ATP-dependent Clp protease protease subunit
MLKIILSCLIGLSSIVATAKENIVLTAKENIVLTETNHASLVGEVNRGSVDKAILQLRSLDSSKTRYLYINSPGGEVVNGLRLINYLRSAEGKGITCIASMAMSMGFVSLQSCEKRLVIDNAMLMSHGIASGMQGYVKQIESELRFAKGLEMLLQIIESRRIGITIEELHKRQNAEWWIIGSTEAIKVNAADDVTDVSCDKELSKVIEDTVEGVKTSITKCPI